jgi:hypothetical protein
VGKCLGSDWVHTQTGNVFFCGFKTEVNRDQVHKNNIRNGKEKKRTGQNKFLTSLPISIKN